jgi:hypothetical protein
MAFDRTVALLRRPALGQFLILFLHLVSLGLFIHGFLLTRVHLPQRASEPPPTANLTGGAPYDRVVWIMIDALRYDFVVTDQRYACASGSTCHQGHMPFLSELARNQVGRLCTRVGSQNIDAAARRGCDMWQRRFSTPPRSAARRRTPPAPSSSWPTRRPPPRSG